LFKLAPTPVFFPLFFDPQLFYFDKKFLLFF